MKTRVENRFPWLTASVAATAVILQLCGERVLAILQWRSDAIATGQLWRLLTGHVVHWSWDHLLWDAAMFGMLGYVIERRSRAALAWCLTGTVALTDLLLEVRGAFDCYRGLSGLSLAAFAWTMGHGFVRGMEKGRKGLAWAAALGWILLAAKTAYEFAFAGAVFVDAAGAGFTVAAEAHLAGAIVGAAVAGFPKAREAVFGIEARRRVDTVPGCS